MNDILLEKMAQDMRLFQFENENKQKFSTRVVYSGMALWMKTITLDNFESESNTTIQSVSKHHYYRRANFILNQMLDFFPEIRFWFIDVQESGNEKHTVHVLRERLLRSKDIIEIDFLNRLSLSSDREIRLSNNLKKHLGISLDGSIQYNGISALSKFEYELVNEEELTQTFDCLSFSESYFKQAKFVKDERTVEKEFYDPYVKTDTFYKAWVDHVPNCDEYISRTTSGSGSHQYFIEKNIDGIIMSHYIDDFLIRSGIYRRFLLALRYKYKNPLQVTIEKYSDHFNLKRFVKEFPFPEESVMQSYGWPIKSLHDSLNWVFHDYLYDEIVKVLKNLLIKINEVCYE